MKKRIITGLIMAVILLPLIFVPACLPVLEFVVVLLTIGAEVELLNMYDKEKKISLPLKILTVLLTLGLCFSIFSYMSTQPGFEVTDSLILRGLDKLYLTKIFTPVTSLLIDFIILMSCMIFKHDFEVKDAGRLFMSIIYVGVCTAAFITLRFYGIRFVIYLLLITVLTDIFALVFGMTFGKHKMAPSISPKKTWEGAIGGTCTAVAIAFVFSYCYPWISSWMTIAGGGQSIQFFDGIFNYSSFSSFGRVLVCIVLALFLSICSQVGDLVASKLKRAYDIKDYSNIFPGHGGVLDRFDSIFFASAMFLLFIMFEQNLFSVVAEQIPIVLAVSGR